MTHRAAGRYDRRALQITLNGKARDLPDGISVSTLLETLEVDPRRVAVEINLDIVPKSEYAERSIDPGDTIELVSFVGGG